MNDPESLSHLLQVCSRKTEDFVRLLDSKHMVWLLEIEDAAKKMFSSDFTAEPELMPKTPSQKRRRKKRTSILPDENRDPSGRRICRRKSSVSWSTSVRRLSSRNMAIPLDTSIQEETEQQPKRMTTRAKAQSSIVCMPVAEKPLEEDASLIPTDRLLQVKITAQERLSAEVQLSEMIKSVSVDKNPLLETVVPTSSAPPAAPVTPEKNGRTATKLQIADSSTPKVQAGSVDLTLDSSPPIAQTEKELATELSNYSVTPTGSKPDRRSVRRSIIGRKSTSCRTSLANQYSLANKRDSMTREAVHKSIRRSVSQKRRSSEKSTSSYKSHQSSIEVIEDEEIIVKIKPETAQPVQEAPEDRKRSMRTRAFNKIAISKQADSEPQQMVTTQTLAAEIVADTDDQTISRRKSYKRAMDDLSDGDQSINEQVNSPPRKKTPSPPCPPSKVIKPPPHMKSFLHTVQKNQLLMMTPGSIGKNFIAKSFIKRNTPLKVDPKEKERQRLESIRKKEEAELLRKQKIEEGKKRKQEELKLRREERQRKVLQARERVELLEEEKKKKMEQKFAQIDEKSEKVREDRLAEEKAKKKMTAKKQEEEARKLKAKQLEEEERRQQELLQKKREEEEQEKQRKLAAEAKKMELERERQLAAEKERERALQLQRELEQQRREAEERKRKEQQERLEQERQERLRKEMEAQKRKELEEQRLREEQQRIVKEKQAAASAQTMNVTVDIQNSSACESYEMTPKGYKVPSIKINADDYGMDLNSDDSTDDETKPRKPIPAWASGNQLSQAMCRQYYHPIDVDKFYGVIDSPKLEDMFYKSKPRYNKRTSSAVWNSPPLHSNRQHLAVGFGLKKY